jgi:hypothetical protein
MTPEERQKLHEEMIEIVIGYCSLVIAIAITIGFIVLIDVSEGMGILIFVFCWFSGLISFATLLIGGLSLELCKFLNRLRSNHGRIMALKEDLSRHDEPTTTGSEDPQDSPIRALIASRKLDIAALKSIAAKRNEEEE